MLDNFAFKSEDGNIVAVVSMSDIAAASRINGYQLEITYDTRKSVVVEVGGVINTTEFFTLLLGDETKSDCGTSDCCNSNQIEMIGSIGDPISEIRPIQETAAHNYHYHVVFDGDVANTIVLHDVNTLYVDHKKKGIYISSQSGLLAKSYPFENYGNLFEKIDGNLYYVIDDLIAIYLYNLLEFKVERLEDELYKVTVRYNNFPERTIMHLLNIDGDRAIHMLNVINRM